MPWIIIDFDDAQVKDEEIVRLANGIKQIVSTVTNIEDVFVYARSARIKVNVAPIELVVRMSAEKIKDREKLFDDIKSGIVQWKKENSFHYPINLTLQPMDWKFETGL